MRDYMNLDQLEAFLYVVELKSVHKAAQALYLSQPTITARIKTLEAELESELFIRNNRQLTLNDNGKAFIPFAEKMLQSFQQAKKALHHQTASKHLQMGANIITAQYFIPHVLTKWANLVPHLQLKFIAATNDQLLQKIKSEEIDFAFIRSTTDDTVTQIPVLDNTVRFVVHPQHPLAKVSSITMQHLRDEKFVFFECGAFDWNLIYKLFEVEQVDPTIYLKTDHLEVAKSFVLTNDCVGFLPYLAVRDELISGELVEIEAKNLVNIQQHIYLTYKKSAPIQLIKQAIIESAQLFSEKPLQRLHQ